MPFPNIAILLAAGQSQRMGSPKALYLLENGHTFLSLLVNTCRAAGVAPLVVTGAHDADIARAYPRLFRVYNRHWRDGQFSSVLCGLRACANAQRILIHPVDAPHVSAQTLKALRDCGEPVAVASYQGTPGHPVALDAATARQLIVSSSDSKQSSLLTTPFSPNPSTELRTGSVEGRRSLRPTPSTLRQGSGQASLGMNGFSASKTNSVLSLRTALKQLRAVPVAVDDPYVLENVNTPAQLEKLTVSRTKRRKPKSGR